MWRSFIFVSSLCMIARPSLSTRLSLTCPFYSDVPMEKFSLAAAEYLAAGDTHWDTWFEGEMGPLNTACFCADSMCNDA